MLIHSRNFLQLLFKLEFGFHNFSHFSFDRGILFNNIINENIWAFDLTLEVWEQVFEFEQIFHLFFLAGFIDFHVLWKFLLYEGGQLSLTHDANYNIINQLYFKINDAIDQTSFNQQIKCRTFGLLNWSK